MSVPSRTPNIAGRDGSGSSISVRAVTNTEPLHRQRHWPGLPWRAMTPGRILLWPGAGGDSSHPTFVTLDAALDIPVDRRDFAYRSKGKRPPPAASTLVAEIRSVVEDTTGAAGADPSHLVLGGRSMGGRMASLAVAEGLPAAGLILLSYPLHPPGKPEKLRVDHFGALDVPCLFVSGTRDPFGSPEEFATHTRAIPGPVTFGWLDGKGHDPRGCDDEITAAVGAWLDTL